MASVPSSDGDRQILPAEQVWFVREDVATVHASLAAPLRSLSHRL